MNLSNLDKRLLVLEANQPEEMTWDKFCEGIEHDIESVHQIYLRNKHGLIDVEKASLAEITTYRIDCSNPWNLIRVMLCIWKLRKNYPDASHVVLKDKRVEWLDNRGVSTKDNLTSDVCILVRLAGSK